MLESNEQIFRYVVHERVIDYARLGWTIADTFSGISHGDFGILMQWICKCPVIEPKQETWRALR